MQVQNKLPIMSVKEQLVNWFTAFVKGLHALFIVKQALVENMGKREKTWEGEKSMARVRDRMEDFKDAVYRSIVLLKQGKEVDRVLGPKKDELEKKVDRSLVLRRMSSRVRLRSTEFNRNVLFDFKYKFG
ncbi:hypothetical protein RHSIM_Rhsim05G0121400 [Rhododendron simsii]|uniref:Uncharacterized protein n=1 Tax=Rhododendron simsii TaxID=118357 RepID=A0A834LKA8_RHOSS|nr:hypothetical protein RHSIM_Rhsim05G0121400 [Rhododendron simsii]